MRCGTSHIQTIQIPRVRHISPLGVGARGSASHRRRGDRATPLAVVAPTPGYFRVLSSSVDQGRGGQVGNFLCVPPRAVNFQFNECSARRAAGILAELPPGGRATMHDGVPKAPVRRARYRPASFTNRAVQPHGHCLSGVSGIRRNTNDAFAKVKKTVAAFSKIEGSKMTKSKRVSPLTFVREAALMADLMERKEHRIRVEKWPETRQRVARHCDVPATRLWGLRYRQPKEIGAHDYFNIASGFARDIGFAGAPDSLAEVPGRLRLAGVAHAALREKEEG